MMTQASILKVDKKIVTASEFLYYTRHTGQVLFSGCNFNEEIKIGSNQRTVIQPKLIFQDCTFIKIIITNAVFTKQLQFHACTFKENLEIHKASFHQTFVADRISANKVSIVDTECREKFELNEYSALKELLLVFERSPTHITVSQNSQGYTSDRIYIMFETDIDAPIVLENLHAQKVVLKFPRTPLSKPLLALGIKAGELWVAGLKSKAKIEFRRVFANSMRFSHLHMTEA